jgi:hypothetical protein
VEKRGFLVFFLCITSLLFQGQNISGFWKGNLTMGSACFPVNNVELQLTIVNDSAFGSTYHYLDVDNYIKKSVEGRYNAASRILNIKELLVSTYHIPNRCVICLKDFQLTYSKEGKLEILKGNWVGNILGTSTPCGPGTLQLSRIKESFFKEAPEVIVDTGTIRLDFYDNGVIDDDSISLKVNKQMVLSNQKLTAKPITIFLKIDEVNTFQEVELIAENEGSISPNTALLIITAGEKRFRLDVSSTETKSAKIRFVYSGGMKTPEEVIQIKQP